VSEAPEPNVRWIAAAPLRPLCDVPWVGTSVVLSDGNVNFCCFSSALVGNVNEASFESIWAGERMQRIRRELTAQRFPAECQSPSCPLFRSDEETFLRQRMDGVAAPNLRDMRWRVRESTLELDKEHLNIWQAPKVTLDLKYEGGAFAADLFIAVQLSDSSFRFLPDYTDYPVPFCRLDAPCVHTVPLLPKYFMLPGRYELSAALFEPESNPNLLASCYWAQAKRIHVEKAQARSLRST